MTVGSLACLAQLCRVLGTPSLLPPSYPLSSGRRPRSPDASPPLARGRAPRMPPMLTEATTPPLDLLLVGGTVVDPSQGLHAKKDVGIFQGRIAFVEDSIPQARARQVVDCSGLIVTPGLVDLH